MSKWNLTRLNHQTPSFFNDFFLPTDTLFDRFVSKNFPEFNSLFGNNTFESVAYPKIDIRETDTQYILEAEINGLEKDQIKVDVREDSLIIRGESRNEKKKEGKYHLQEIKRSSFGRYFSLPPEIVNKNTVKAKFNNGILEITVDKLKPIPPPIPEVRAIEIQ